MLARLRPGIEGQQQSAMFRLCLETSRSTKASRVRKCRCWLRLRLPEVVQRTNHHNRSGTGKSKVQVHTKRIDTSRSLKASARDKEMSQLSGHHRIMEAAEAALVMMVLEVGGSFWASFVVASRVKRVFVLANICVGGRCGRRMGGRGTRENYSSPGRQDNAAAAGARLTKPPEQLLPTSQTIS
jgi:hypothetical protein